MAFAIFHNLIINAPAMTVFAGFTEPEHLVNWWPLQCSGQAVPGGVYNFNFTDEYDWYAYVDAIQTGVSCSWKMSQADEDWNPTSFGFEIEERDGACMLRFFHKDWQYANDHFKISSYCWAILLSGLKAYLEDGVVVPFEKRS